MGPEDYPQIGLDPGLSDATETALYVDGILEAPDQRRRVKGKPGTAKAGWSLIENSDCTGGF